MKLPSRGRSAQFHACALMLSELRKSLNNAVVSYAHCRLIVRLWRELFFKGRCHRGTRACVGQAMCTEAKRSYQKMSQQNISVSCVVECLAQRGGQCWITPIQRMGDYYMRKNNNERYINKRTLCQGRGNI